MKNNNAENVDSETVILAVDPGKDKCGVAIMRVRDERVLVREIVPRAAILSNLERQFSAFSGAILVIGHATTSRDLRAQLATKFPEIEVQTVDETGSTLEARALYWNENPARGWRRLWPQSLQMPPEPIDDFAAVVLAQRFLQRTHAQN